jgi:hypothetical protein
VRDAELSMQKLITELRSGHGDKSPPAVNRTTDPQSGYRFGRPKHEND